MPKVANRTPELSELIQTYVNQGAKDLRVSMPGVITEYDPLTEYAVVQPCLKETPPGGSAENLPSIEDVKVMHPSCRMGNAGGYAIVHLPVTAGTPGLLIFGDRSYDAWINQPTAPGILPVDPLDTRYHDLSDAVFLPGFNPKIRTIAPPILPTYQNDIRISLYYPEQGINSQFWLGGDTGDIVAVPSPQGAVRLGARSAVTYNAETEPNKVVLDTLLVQGVPALATALATAIVTALSIATPNPVTIAQPALEQAISAGLLAFCQSSGTDRIKGAI